MTRHNRTSLMIVAATLVALAAGGCTPVEPDGVGKGAPAALEGTSLLREMDSGDETQWKEATGRIEDAGMEAREFLLDALRFNDGGEESARIREYAARRLGQLKAPDATVELVAALRDASRFVSSEAASALTNVQDPLAVPLIIEMLEGSPRPESDAEGQMFDVLKKITGRIEGYEYRFSEVARAEAIEQCKGWWAEHSDENGLQVKEMGHNSR